MKLRRIVIHGIAFAAALAAGSCARSSDSGAAQDPEPVVPVRLAEVRIRPFTDAVRASGNWRTTGELIVSAPFTCVIDSLGAQVGDPVRRSQRLGWLLTRESFGALRGAEMLARSATDAQARTEAERALQVARSSVVRVPLLAGADGTVLRRTVEVSAEVPEGGEILALSPAGALVFEAHLPVDEAASVRPGETATVEMTGVAPVRARVSRLLPGVDASSRPLAWLTPAQTLEHGWLQRAGEARIEYGTARRSAAVPRPAIVEDDLTGEKRVAVVGADSLAVWTTLELGVTDGDWSEVLAPRLAPGTAVVVEGQRGLPDSARVTSTP